MTRAGVVSWREAWELTPRQLRALLFLNTQETLSDNADSLIVQRLAAHGDPDRVKKVLRDWA